LKPTFERKQMIDPEFKKLSITKQCKVLEIHRSGLYYKPIGESEENLRIMRILDEQYFKTPFYGIRKLTKWLAEKGIKVNHKRTKRLMGVMGWQTIFRKKLLTQRRKGDPVFPYLLKGLAINRKNQVWAIDITYIPMKHGFMYLIAIIDVYSRYVLNWSISNSQDAEWVAEVVKETIEQHGQPEIINSDQGSQFGSFVYTNLLLNREKPIAISMDGKGRAIDNIFIERLWKSVKYECVYLNAFEDGVKLFNGLKEYFHFYNHERFHQSLDYKKPADCYRDAA
jgi:putative transposase